MRLSLCIAALLLAPECAVAQVIGVAVPAANYFVNGATGSDSNAGTTPGQAFATVTKLASVLTTGQVGAIAGGQASRCDAPITYREQLTVPAANITIAGYGCQPLLDASDSISAGAWSKTGGYSNIYQATVATAAVSGTAFLRAWENGVGFAQAASLAALDSSASSYYVASNGTLSGSSFTLYVHTSDDSSPGSNGRTYEYNARKYGLFSTYDNTRVLGLRTRRNLENNGSLEVGRYAFVSNVRADEGTKHNMLVHAGSTVQHSSLREAYYAGQSLILLVYNENTPNGEGLTFRNVTASMPTYTLGAVGVSGHYNQGGSFGWIVFDSITVTNCQSGIADGSNTGATFTTIAVSGGQGGITVYSPAATISGATITATGQAVTIANADTSVSITSSSLTSSVANQGAVRSTGTGVTLTLANSTIANTSAGSFAVELTGASSRLTMSGNTFTFTPGTRNAYKLASGFSAFVSNGNAFPSNVGSNSVANINSTWYTLAQVRSTFGQDTTSTP